MTKVVLDPLVHVVPDNGSVQGGSTVFLTIVTTI